MAMTSKSDSTASGDIEQSLYAKRKKIYPREVHGLFAWMRASGVFILLGLYYILPWLQWDERQMVLFDLPARKFYIFGMVFWPQDFFYLMLLLVAAALSLFFFTALAGRLWCGYACPQTVWTEAFLWIERKIEGNRPQQMKLDKQSLSWRKFRLKASKHFIWIVFSLYTGLTFVGYFSPIRELSVNFLQLQTGPWETFWILFYGLATYGNAGWLREQVCTYMCPYARFQSAMIDKDTLIISYDPARGEPRGSRKKSADPRQQGLGDCIDCTICVQVCPTGIDIRDGLQYQCIGCAACIDACDGVMEQMGYAKGLISYTTENNLEGRPTRLLRPRIVIYATILFAVLAGTAYSIYSRVPLVLDVVRDRSSLFRETDEGLIENVYQVKIVNMDQRAHRYNLSVEGLEGASLLLDDARIEVDSGEVLEMPVRVRVDPELLQNRSATLHFRLSANDGADLQRIEEARFIGPAPTR